MRRCLAALAGLLIAAAVQTLPAQAEAIDPATATCGELTKAFGAPSSGRADTESQSRFGVLLLWMAGFLAPESQGTVIDLTQIQSDVEKIAVACIETPALGIKTVASKMWEKEQPTTPNSIDISTLKCSALTQKLDDRAAAALLWLIGNYASEDDTPMFDIAEIGTTLEKIAIECRRAPDMSIATAAEKVLE